MIKRPFAVDALKELKMIKTHARNIGSDSMTAAAFPVCREEAKQADSLCGSCYETHNKSVSGIASDSPAIVSYQSDSPVIREIQKKEGKKERS